MRKKQGFVSILGFLSCALLAACAAQPVKTPPPFNAQPIQGQWIPKADHLYFILDASSSMEDSYAGYVKFDTAKAIVANFNQTMPDVNVQAALRGFGFSTSLSEKVTLLFYGPQDYSRTGLAEGVNEIAQPGGTSPMWEALYAAAVDLKESEGPVALVIVSDGKDMGHGELRAADSLVAQLNGRVCLYTVMVGDDPAGKTLLEKIAAVSSCGRFTNADSLASPAGMAAFVQDVLLAGQADSDGDGVADDKDRCPDTPRGASVDTSGCPTDSDGDGVYDYLDKCPGTQPGMKVGADGCPIPVATRSAEVTEAGTWIYKGVQFEINKADLRPSSYGVLDEIAEGLKTQAAIKVEVQGHTDNTGSPEYNMKLSQARAESVKEYLVDKGIAPERLTAKGYGMTRPLVPNDTAQNRAKNRRVELAPRQ
ncbi:MAG TPA: OmpA family protein [Deltaproteobacteria bacterium]|mgnify:FL=1|nr:OmpA family protein [Deltaproteobacteria bacterium]